MNMPNFLTIIRLFLIPIFIIVFFSTLEYHLYYATFIFILAGITDVLDGYIARKYNLITKLGQVMDPFADKLMQLAVLSCLTIDKLIPIWFIIIYGIKELTMIFGGLFLYTKKDKIVIPANKYGKLATVIFYIAVVSIPLKLPYANYLFILAIGYSLFAFIQYTIIGSKKMKKLD